MDNLNLISNFAEFKELKNIDKSTMIGVLEDVFRHALEKQYETDQNFDVIINPERATSKSGATAPWSRMVPWRIPTSKSPCRR